MNSYGSVSLVSGAIYKLLRHLNWFAEPNKGQDKGEEQEPKLEPEPEPEHADQINELPLT